MREKIRSYCEQLLSESGYTLGSNFALWDADTNRSSALEDFAHYAGVSIMPRDTAKRVREVVAVCCDEFGCTAEQVMSATRNRMHIADARKAAYWVLTHEGYPMRMTGAQLGRTRMAVFFGTRSVNETWPYDKELTKHLNNIKTKLYGGE